MAPTQVLARQHYEDLKALVEPLGFKAVYLGGACLLYTSMGFLRESWLA